MVQKPETQITHQDSLCFLAADGPSDTGQVLAVPPGSISPACVPLKHGLLCHIKVYSVGESFRSGEELLKTAAFSEFRTQKDVFLSSCWATYPFIIQPAKNPQALLVAHTQRKKICLTGIDLSMEKKELLLPRLVNIG